MSMDVIARMMAAAARSAANITSGVLAVARGGTGVSSVAGIRAIAASSQLSLTATGVNFNSANSDTTIPIALPTGFTRYLLTAVRLNGASASLTTATCAAYTGAGGTGTALVASGTAITVSTASDNTANNAQSLSPVNVSGLALAVATVPNIYFRVQNAQGSAATGCVTLIILPLP